MAETTPFKEFLNKKALAEFARAMGGVYPVFKPKEYERAVLEGGLEKLELKDRCALMAAKLKGFLPADYSKAAALLTKAGPKLNGLQNWVLTSYIEQFGLEHFDDSVRAMKQLTRYSSAEFCIRPFMNRYFERMIPLLLEWAEDKNEHVRRLAAEGSRPRGVWTAHVDELKRDPRPAIEILEKLKADPSPYVRKAVANNLNDISKDHPDIAIKTAERWMKAGHPDTEWIVKHACRSLIKSGDPRVFGIFGFEKDPKLKVALKVDPKKPKIGGKVTLALAVESQAKKPQKLAVDYVVHFILKTGKTGRKVFKWAEKTLKPGEVLKIEKKHAFVNHSTRTHYPGRHKIEVQINGRVAAKADITLGK